MNSKGESPAQKPRDPDFVGADAAMRRAAKRARQRAKETSETAAANKDSGQSGRGVRGIEARPGEKQGMNTNRDPRERGSRKAE